MEREHETYGDAIERQHALAKEALRRAAHDQEGLAEAGEGAGAGEAEGGAEEESSGGRGYSGSSQPQKREGSGFIEALTQGIRAGGEAIASGIEYMGRQPGEDGVGGAIAGGIGQGIGELAEGAASSIGFVAGSGLEIAGEVAKRSGELMKPPGREGDEIPPELAVAVDTGKPILSSEGVVNDPGSMHHLESHQADAPRGLNWGAGAHHSTMPHHPASGFGPSSGQDTMPDFSGPDTFSRRLTSSPRCTTSHSGSHMNTAEILSYGEGGKRG